jgi:hypothetical protein
MIDKKIRNLLNERASKRTSSSGDHDALGRLCTRRHFQDDMMMMILLQAE